MDVVEGIRMLAERGVVCVFESPYLINFLTQTHFDTIYHEHISYFSLTALKNLFRRVGLVMFDCHYVELHGGSMIVYVGSTNYGFQESVRIAKALKAEKQIGLTSLEPYSFFALNVVRLKNDLINVMSIIKSQDKRVVGYGAPAKGNTLLNYCGFGRAEIDYVVDNTPLKQGRYLLLTHLHVVSDEHLKHDHPDILFLLAWNFAS